VVARRWEALIERVAAPRGAVREAVSP
jgi:hypothetical protein